MAIEQKKLTLKQQRFIKEYVKSGNGTQSAIKAGYSKKSAREIAKENMTKPLIKEVINKVMSNEAEKFF
jgi:phage terminase small subunit